MMKKLYLVLSTICMAIVCSSCMAPENTPRGSTSKFTRDNISILSTETTFITTSTTTKSDTTTTCSKATTTTRDTMTRATTTTTKTNKKKPIKEVVERELITVTLPEGPLAFPTYRTASMNIESIQNRITIFKTEADTINKVYEKHEKCLQECITYLDERESLLKEANSALSKARQEGDLESYVVYQKSVEKRQEHVKYYQEKVDQLNNRLHTLKENLDFRKSEIQRYKELLKELENKTTLKN